MPIIRRCAAFVTCLLLLQSTVLGNRLACDTHGENDATSLVRHEGTHSPAPASSGDCGAPGTIGACASMPACAVTLGVPPHTVASVTLLPPRASLPDLVSTHSQNRPGPEVPPPRG